MVVLGAVDAGTATAIIAVILGGGGIGTIALIRKTPSEIEATSVKTMAEVTTELRTEARRAWGLNEELRTRNDQLVTQMQEQRTRYEALIADLTSALERAKGQVEVLTQEVNDLETAHDEAGS